jgi:hypothetical protein
MDLENINKILLSAKAVGVGGHHTHLNRQTGSSNFETIPIISKAVPYDKIDNIQIIHKKGRDDLRGSIKFKDGNEENIYLGNKLHIEGIEDLGELGKGEYKCHSYRGTERCGVLPKRVFFPRQSLPRATFEGEMKRKVPATIIDRLENKYHVDNLFIYCAELTRTRRLDSYVDGFWEHTWTTKLPTKFEFHRSGTKLQIDRDKIKRLSFKRVMKVKQGPGYKKDFWLVDIELRSGAKHELMLHDKYQILHPDWGRFPLIAKVGDFYMTFSFGAIKNITFGE